MADKVENMSLDDIIKQNNKGRGGVGRKFGGRGRGRGAAGRGLLRVSGGGVAPLRQRRNFGNVGKSFARESGNIEGRWQHDLFEGGVGRGRGAVAGGSSKLLVSNLDFGVSDSDISELFSEFGPLKVASIHYDRSGRSLGLADVVFERRADANKAFKVYNNVPLDGRPMKIKFADELNAAAAPPAFVQTPRPRRQSFAGRGRGRGRGRPNVGGGAGKKNVTAEELDAELDAWKSAQ